MSAKSYVGGAVVVDPEILGGSPVFAGTRVPVENLFDFLSGGFDVAEFLQKFPQVQREHALMVIAESRDALAAEISGDAA